MLGHGTITPEQRQGCYWTLVQSRSSDSSRHETYRRAAMETNSRFTCARFAEPSNADAGFYMRTRRAFSGCTGRLFAKPTALLNAAICSFDAVTGLRTTSQVTPSEHGGVVSEPANR